MIPQIKKILYTTDLSDNSAYVFRYAINSAKKHDANIIILHVLERMSSNTKALIGSHLSEEIERKISEDRKAWSMDRIKNRLKVFCEKELTDDPDCKDRVDAIKVCEGFPAEVILQKADELNCDAIIMGTHGKGIIANTFLGSTSKRVLRRTRKPVFIIPLPKGEIDISFHDI
ncbi:MAG: universal stress protein [Desulfobacterales bacterium]|jgi:nucleotide-binding universal stress UspA family protein